MVRASASGQFTLAKATVHARSASAGPPCSTHAAPNTTLAIHRAWREVEWQGGAQGAHQAKFPGTEGSMPLPIAGPIGEELWVEGSRHDARHSQKHCWNPVRRGKEAGLL